MEDVIFEEGTEELAGHWSVSDLAMCLEKQFRILAEWPDEIEKVPGRRLEQNSLSLSAVGAKAIPVAVRA